MLCGLKSSCFGGAQAARRNNNDDDGFAVPAHKRLPTHAAVAPARAGHAAQAGSVAPAATAHGVVLVDAAATIRSTPASNKHQPVVPRAGPLPAAALGTQPRNHHNYGAAAAINPAEPDRVAPHSVAGNPEAHSRCSPHHHNRSTPPSTGAAFVPQSPEQIAADAELAVRLTQCRPDEVAQLLGGPSATGVEGGHLEADAEIARRMAEEDEAALRDAAGGQFAADADLARRLAAEEAEAAARVAERWREDEAAACAEVERLILEQDLAQEASSRAAAEDAALAQYAEETGQDVDELDREALLRDVAEPTFVCGIMLTECDRASEGVCIGQHSWRLCGHTVSRDALAAYVMAEAESFAIEYPCPVCKAAPCPRCPASNGGAGHCTIPMRQIRELLSEDDLERVITQQRKAFEMVNQRNIVHCPHPDCSFYYVVEAGQDGRTDGADGKLAWREGRDMWCQECRVQYCLHCGDALGKLVKWHPGNTCANFLRAVEAERTAPERERRAQAAAAERSFRGVRGVNWQECPKCHLWAFKSDSECNRVMCGQQCKTDFCFLCGTKISPRGSYAHFSDKKSPCYGRLFHKPK